jgi:hypothetical protein
MKKLTTFLLVLIPTISLAQQGWNSLEDNVVYVEKSFCESQTSLPCYDVAACPVEHCDLVDEIVNGEPLYTVNNQQSCTLDVPTIEGEENTKTDCQLKLEALSCDENFEAILREDLLEVRCTRLDGYEQINTGRKVLAVNPSKKAAYEAQQAAKLQLETALAQARKLRECGNNVIDLLLVRNASKGLTTTQVKQIVSTYAPIQGLLQTGSLNSAKEEIQAVEADGTLVTNEDKAALTAEIDKCL